MELLTPGCHQQNNLACLATATLNGDEISRLTLRLEELGVRGGDEVFNRLALAALSDAARKGDLVLAVAREVVMYV